MDLLMKFSCIFDIKNERIITPFVKFVERNIYKISKKIRSDNNILKKIAIARSTLKAIMNREEKDDENNDEKDGENED